MRADSGEAESAGRAYVQIGLQQKLFKKEQVAEAERAGKPVHEHLLARGVITPDQHKGLERAVAYRLGRDEDKKVAQLVVEHGYCSQAAVEKALKQQKDFYGKTGELMRLGTLLVEMGSLSDSQHLAAIKLFRLGGVKKG